MFLASDPGEVARKIRPKIQDCVIRFFRRCFISVLSSEILFKTSLEMKPNMP